METLKKKERSKLMEIIIYLAIALVIWYFFVARKPNKF